MNKQLKNMRDKVRRNRRAEDGQTGADGGDSSENHSDEVEEEREQVLSAGRSFSRPLAMSPQKALKITAAIVIGLLVLALLVFSVLIYRFQSDSEVVYRVSQVIPFPAACVDGSSQLTPYPSLCAGGSLMRYDDYLFELRALKQYSQNTITGDGIDFSSDEGREQLRELQVLALDEARNKLIVQQIADERGVEVSDEQLEEAVGEFVTEEGDEEQLEQSLEEFYGWRMADFESVLAGQLLQQEIVRQYAEDVLAEVEAGERDFAELAIEYSDDGSAQEGGDIGFVTENSEFVEEFEVAALELEEGETSGLVDTQFGFHILKATEEDEEEGMRISHILISPSFLQEEIAQRQDSARSNSFISVAFPSDEIEEDPHSEPEAGESAGSGE